MELDPSWTKNTSYAINNVYVEIIRCLKYASEEEKYGCIEDLGLKDPIKWACWADEQFKIEQLKIEREEAKINVTVYEIDNDTKLYTYTATWCGPCKRIKPVVINIMSKHNYKVLSQEIIEKSLFKKDVNEFIPFFVIKKLEEKIDSVQTSNELLFKQFLSKNGISMVVLDENF